MLASFTSYAPTPNDIMNPFHELDEPWEDVWSDCCETLSQREECIGVQSVWLVNNECDYVTTRGLGPPSRAELSLFCGGFSEEVGCVGGTVVSRLRVVYLAASNRALCQSPRPDDELYG